jgi:hypothetical protein
MHHIALMRPVELVVKYLEGNPLPDARLEWAGVFIAAPLDRGERNALDHLLAKLSYAGLVADKIPRLRAAISEEASVPEVCKTTVRKDRARETGRSGGRDKAERRSRPEHTALSCCQ